MADPFDPFADFPKQPLGGSGANTEDDPFADFPIVPVKPQTGVPEGFEIPNTEPQIAPGDDAFYTGISSLGRGALAVPGMVADTLGLGMQAGRGLDWLWQKHIQGKEPVVPSADEVAARNPLRGITSQGLEEKYERATGTEFYNPQTRAGEVTDTLLRPVPGAIAFGGKPSQPFKSAIEYGIVPAAAGETVATGFNAAGMPELAEGARVATEVVTGGGSSLRKPRDRAPSYDRIKRQAAQDFIEVDRAGVQISQQGLNRLATNVRNTTANRLTGIPEIDRTLSSETRSLLSGVDAMARMGGVPLTTVHKLRQMIDSQLNKADITDADTRILKGAKRQIDEFFDTMGSGDTVGGGWGMGKTLRRGIRGYAKQMRVEEVQNRIDRANKRVNAETGFTPEKALRSEFRTMSLDEDTMAMFSPRERKAIISISQGGDIAQKLSSFAPNSALGLLKLSLGSMLLGGGSGYAAGSPGFGAGIGGIPLAIGGAGELGRLASKAITNRNLARTGQMVRGGAGYSVPSGPLMAPLSMYYATTAANTPNSRDAVTNALTPGEIYSPKVDSAYQAVIDALIPK